MSSFEKFVVFFLAVVLVELTILGVLVGNLLLIIT